MGATQQAVKNPPIIPVPTTPQPTGIPNTDNMYKNPATLTQQSPVVPPTPPAQVNNTTPPNTNTQTANPTIIRNQNATPAPTIPATTTKKPTNAQPTQLDQQSQIIDNQQKQLDYQTADQARLDEVRNNLNDAQINNPSSFSDRATFEKAYNYASRSPEQKEILDASFSAFNNKGK